MVLLTQPLHEIDSTEQGSERLEWGGLRAEIKHHIAPKKEANLNLLDSQRIHGRNKLTKYIPEGRIFRSIGYDWNCSLIHEIMKENLYDKSTIIIGYNMSGTNEDEYTIAALHQYIEDGKLEIRTPKKGTWHEKFFVTEGEDSDTGIPFWIDVNGSSNPTITGSGKRGSQSNRITRIGFTGEYSSHEYVKNYFYGMCHAIEFACTTNTTRGSSCVITSH